MAARHRRCPTPDKVRYASRGGAEAALRRMSSERIECRPYRCRKHWHLTSQPRR